MRLSALVVVMLVALPVPLPATSPSPLDAATAELETSRRVVGVSARAWEAAGGGGAFRQPPMSRPANRGLQEAMRQRLDLAKSVATDLERRVEMLATLGTGDVAPVPVPLAPDDGVRVDRLREPLTLAWTAVTDAAAYAVEVQCLGCCVRGEWCVEHYEARHTSTRLVVRYRGPARWRVRAVMSDERLGPASDWRAIGDVGSLSPAAFNAR